MKIRIAILCFFLVQNIITFGQIKINLPVERMVFQRNNNQQGTVNISGNYFQPIDVVEARVVPKWEGTGVESDWAIVQTGPTFGYFVGSIVVQQGWYQLEVRAKLGGNVVATQIVNKVGVGEVFVVAGQSNAQGGAVQGYGAVDDRVNSVNYVDAFSDINRLPLGFSQIKDSSYIGPYHYVPWFYGKLGDLLADKLNVPILFYGAGYGGASSTQFAMSSLGMPFDGPIWMLQNLGAPYKPLEDAVTFYGSLTGLRGVLWQQGESDGTTNALDYHNNVLTIINQTRTATEFPDLAWMTAFASRNPVYSQEVIDGQASLVNNVSNVYPGPFVDAINGVENRRDGIHFDTYDGLTAVANDWNAALNASFFSTSIPMLATPILKPSIINSSEITAPAGYAQYFWSNRQNTKQENMGTYANCCSTFNVQPPATYETFNWKASNANTNTINTSSGRYTFHVRKASKKVQFGVVLDFDSVLKPSGSNN